MIASLPTHSDEICLKDMREKAIPLLPGYLPSLRKMVPRDAPGAKFMQVFPMPALWPRQD